MDLGLCMTSVLAKRMRLRRADLRFKDVFAGPQNSSEVGTAHLQGLDAFDGSSPMAFCLMTKCFLG